MGTKRVLCFIVSGVVFLSSCTQIMDLLDSTPDEEKKTIILAGSQVRQNKAGDSYEYTVTGDLLSVSTGESITFTGTQLQSFYSDISTFAYPTLKLVGITSIIFPSGYESLTLSSQWYDISTGKILKDSTNGLVTQILEEELITYLIGATSSRVITFENGVQDTTVVNVRSKRDWENDTHLFQDVWVCTKTKNDDETTSSGTIYYVPTLGAPCYLEMKSGNASSIMNMKASLVSHTALN